MSYVHYMKAESAEEDENPFNGWGSVCENCIFVGLGCARRGRYGTASLSGEDCAEPLPTLLGERLMSDLSSAGESSSSSSSSAAAPSLRNQPSTRCGSILELLPILSLSSTELDRENGLAWANGERALVSTRCRFLRNRESENGASSLHNKKIYKGKGSNFVIF